MRLIKTPFERDRSTPRKGDIYLGSWCLKEEEITQRFSYNIVDYHWDDRKKYYDDYKYLTICYENTLSQLSCRLNEIHNLNEDKSYWRIIIGPWLRFFTDAVFDRYECVRLAGEYDLDENYLADYNISSWIAKDFNDFYYQLTNDNWNEVLISECIKFQKIPWNKSYDIFIEQDSLYEKKIHKKDILKKLSAYFFRYISKKYKNIVYVSPYISLRKLLKLNLALLQFPCRINEIVAIPKCERDNLIRDDLLKPVTDAPFDVFLCRQIGNFLPQVYLENFLFVRDQIKNLLPIQPKAIFTSVAYQGDDIFKIWSAEQKKLDTPLFINQHGGNMGISKFNQTLDHQLMVSDRFFSWGWNTKDHDNILSMPSLLLSGARDAKVGVSNHILHVVNSMPRYFYCQYSVPVGGQYLSYLDNQIKFFNGLNDYESNKLQIRLPKRVGLGDWDLEKFFVKNGYAGHISRSDNDIWGELKKSRLCICTHNATVFLQTLARNFPTIIFWDNEHNELDQSAKPLIEMLVDAEILFFSPEAAASKVNKVYSDVQRWWTLDNVQLARRQFCQKFALVSDSWLHDWSSTLSGRNL